MPDCIGFNLIEAVLCHICRKERPGAVLVFMTGWEDISCLRDQLKAHPLLGDPNRVLLLTCHGSMPTSEQVGISALKCEDWYSPTFAGVHRTLIAFCNFIDDCTT